MERHPDVAARVLASLPRSERTLLELVELTGANWKNALDDVRILDSVHGVEVLEETVDGAKVRLAVDACFLPRVVEGTGVMPQFPFEVSQGCDHWLVITERERAKAFVEHLENQGVKATVTFAGEYSPSPTLTTRQREILDTAASYGFYDYPRRITLSHLAEKLGIAKSTLSESLMTIEREVIGAVVKKNGAHRVQTHAHDIAKGHR